MIYHGCSNVFGVYIYDKALSIYLKISKQQHMIQFVCLFYSFSQLWLQIYEYIFLVWFVLLDLLFYVYVL